MEVSSHKESTGDVLFLVLESGDLVLGCVNSGGSLPVGGDVSCNREYALTDTNHRLSL